MKLAGKIIMCAILFYGSNCYSQDAGGQLPGRTQIEDKYKWNLTDIYAADEKWEQDFQWVNDNFMKYRDFEGKIHSSASQLHELLKFDQEVGEKLGRLSLYAMLAKDEDLTQTANQSRYDRINTLYSKVGAAASFVRPEILSIPDDKISSFMAEVKELSVYKHYLDDLFRTKAHTLSKEIEEVMAFSSPVNQLPYDAFSVFTDAELQFPSVKDSKGNTIDISHGRYYAAMYSTDREYRKEVYKGFHKPFIDYKNTLATLLNGIIKAHVFNSKVRKFNDCREAALNSNNIPVNVYDNLVKTVNENLAPLHRWAALKKRIQKVDELHPYDTYVTLFPAVKQEYTFEQGKQLVLEALKPLGEDYIASLNKAFDNRWIDVYETKGKRSGAYSSGTTYGMHPYVLLNWNNQLNDVFTLAHEMGHNMHSFYTGQTQPYPYADYSIFLAEVASTANEALLLDYLIGKASTKEEKLALIEKYLTNITTTFYRQTAFAEYEQKIHERTEKGESLTSESLTDLYKEITTKYWGPAVVIDPEECFTWARIPHFYYNFYVYQYATGYAASQALTASIKKEGKPAIEKYLNFLKAGSSEYAIDVLRNAGVDMTSAGPVLQTAQKMNQLLDQMEELLK